MTTGTAKMAKQDVKRVAHKAEQASSSPLVEAIERYGYIVRGLIYFIIGLMAVQLAMGGRGATTDQTGAIAMIGAQPMGHLLLILVAVGLADYSLWGFIRAIFDPLHRGTSAKGIVERIGFLVSGVSYGILVMPAAQYAMNKPSGQSSGNPGVLSGLLFGQPYGRWLVLAWGVFWLVAAFGQFYSAYTAHFVRDFNTGRMSGPEYRWANRIGRFGFAARGVVFGIIGWFVLESALTGNPNKAIGFDGALLKLAQAPSGPYLLAIVALGLVAFGVYSALCAKWNKVG